MKHTFSVLATLPPVNGFWAKELWNKGVCIKHNHSIWSQKCSCVVFQAWNMLSHKLEQVRKPHCLKKLLVVILMALSELPQQWINPSFVFSRDFSETFDQDGYIIIDDFLTPEALQFLRYT